jgi:hypothetical protein
MDEGQTMANKLGFPLLKFFLYQNRLGEIAKGLNTVLSEAAKSVSVPHKD